jgi:hypothetical protein
MTSLGGVVQQLKKEHERLTRELRGVTAALAAFGTAYVKGTGTHRKMSAVARARIAAAQRARWAKVKANSEQKKNVVAVPKKRTISAAARRKMAAAQKARWAKVRAAQKKSA